MSMRSWSEQGYGYSLFPLNDDNLQKVVDFIIENDEKKYSLEDIKEMRECEDEFDLEYIIGDPVCYKVTNIMNRLEGTMVFCGYLPCGDTDVESHIGICPFYPWECPTMTKEQADSLLEKYAKILGITEKADYFDLEYFG